MCMKYIIHSAHIPVQALNLYCKTIYINLPLKSFKVCLCITISVRNHEFQYVVRLVCLDDHSHFSTFYKIDDFG